MGRARLIAVSALCALVTAIVAVEVASNGSGSGGDARSARAYMKARIEFLRDAQARWARSRAAADRYANSVAVECAGAARGAPIEPRVIQRRTAGGGEIRVSTRDDVLLATLDGVSTAFSAVAAPATERFGTAIRRLSWSDPRVARAMRAYGAQQAAPPAEPAPTPSRLCDAVREWAKSGLRTEPAVLRGPETAPARPDEAVTRALNAAGCLAGDPPQALLALARARGGEDVQSLYRRVQALEDRSGRRNGRAISVAVARVEHALDLPPLAPSPHRVAKRRAGPVPPTCGPSPIPGSIL